jgi:single-strand DNA-binding protein
VGAVGYGHIHKEIIVSTHVTLIGNATGDPDLKYFTGGTAKASFGLAVNRYWNDENGEKKDQVSYFTVEGWRYTAEDIARVVEKGIRVVVVGKMEQQSWEDKETGEKRSKVVVIADHVAIHSMSIESVERRRGGGAGIADESVSTASRKAPQPAKKAAPRPAARREDLDEEPF